MKLPPLTKHLHKSISNRVPTSTSAKETHAWGRGELFCNWRRKKPKATNIACLSNCVSNRFFTITNKDMFIINIPLQLPGKHQLKWLKHRILTSSLSIDCQFHPWPKQPTWQLRKKHWLKIHHWKWAHEKNNIKNSFVPKNWLVKKVIQKKKMIIIIG